MTHSALKRLRPKGRRAGLAAAAVAVAGALALAGCGSSSPVSSSPTTASPSTASPTTVSPTTTSPATASPSSPTTVSPSSVLYAWGRPLGGGGRHRKKKAGGQTTTSTTASGAGSGHQARKPDSGAGYRVPTHISGVPGTVVQIATSNSDSYALTSAGTVWAWGAGRSGELGNGTTAFDAVKAVQVDFPTGVKITALPNPMPFDGGMAIDTTGDVWGWGNDSAHQFCLATTTALTRPTRIPVGHVSLAVGALKHTLYDVGGHIEGCGSGTEGQLGNGTTGTSSTPTGVKGLPAGQVTDLTASWGDEGALLSNGSYYDWGFNAGGQVGDGSTTLQNTAVKVDLPEGVAQVSQGGSTAKNGQTMVILSDGDLWVWGNGQDGQLGLGSTSNATRPEQLTEPAGARFVHINSGGATDYAIDSTGRLWAWGSNAIGQLGTGSSESIATRPVDVGTHLTQVSSTASNVAGYEHT